MFLLSLFLGTSVTRLLQADAGTNTVIASIGSGSTTANPEFYHQFSVSFGYTTSDASTLDSKVDLVTYTQFGSTMHLSTDAFGVLSLSSDWADATTSVLYNSPLSVSANERYQIASGDSGTNTVISSVGLGYATANPEYYLQVQNTFTATGISGSDTVVLTGTLFGSSPVTIVTLNTGNGWSTTAWSDYNYAVTFPGTSTASSLSERWALSGGATSTGALTAGGTTYSEAYTHQFLVSFGYTTSDSSTLVSQSNLVTYTQFAVTMHLSTGVSGALTASSDWADAGTAVTYVSPVAISGNERYKIASGDAGSHTVIASVGLGAVTADPLYYHQVQNTFTVTGLSGGDSVALTGTYFGTGRLNYRYA